MGSIEYIKKSEVMKLRARSKSSTHADINAGLLTRPVRTGGRSVAWPRHEINVLNAARLAGKSDDEIRQIVEALHIARQEAE
ncbi:MAG: transcriptional regulator [Sideroxydans sp.]|nr:transcriptional regulator [Sideroxydans sp.]